MDVQAALEAAKTFVVQNPTVVLVVVFVIYRIYRALYPVPFPEDVPGSKVKSLASMKDFDALFDTSEKAKRKLVVVDCKSCHLSIWSNRAELTVCAYIDYATWCPPCKKIQRLFEYMQFEMMRACRQSSSSNLWRNVQGICLGSIYGEYG